MAAGIHVAMSMGSYTTYYVSDELVSEATK